MIPLVLRMKREAHRRIARAQDIVVETLYEVFDDAVLHGGTAIWRCYQGNRFSEDVDVYISHDVKKIESLFLKFQKKGFLIVKKKVSERSIYSTLKFQDALVRFEAIFKKSRGILKEYETIDGNFITVYTLTPEEFITEKIDTYVQRKKIRDLYDIFFLLRHVQDFSKITPKVAQLMHSYEKPVDEADLKVLLLEGLVPSAMQMREYIGRKRG